MKIIPDTSALVEGLLAKGIPEGTKEIIIHEALLAELEQLALESKDTGIFGLEEIERIRDLCEARGITLSFTGQRTRNAGEIDALIRDLAYMTGGTLATVNDVQARVARAKGISTIRLEREHDGKLLLEDYFDEKTMSVHLREGMVPHAKKGAPGTWTFEKIRDSKMTPAILWEITENLLEKTGRGDAFIEIERKGSTILQVGRYRVVVTKPPFSDGMELTAVRPVKLLGLDEYNLSAKLVERLQKTAEGILIAGSPGQGKTTFARALAINYADKGKVVKTVEAPRDLILPESITQYSISHGSAEEIHDILLLSRPDYTIFDEMRNTDDFRLFADMRLSGVGMIGIVHATAPIDAIQRFIGRIELGVIPQIIDTVIFIKEGGVQKVFEIKMTVKVPSGMMEADLARPVIVVTDFQTGKPEYEMYTYGEQTVVIPVEMAEQHTKSLTIAQEAVEEKLRKYSKDVKVEMQGGDRMYVYLPSKDIGGFIGKGGENIQEVEKEIGLHIDVRELPSSPEPVPYEMTNKKRYIIFEPEEEMTGKELDIYIDGKYLLTARVGTNNQIKIHKGSEVGKNVAHAVTVGKTIELK